MLNMIDYQRLWFDLKVEMIQIISEESREDERSWELNVKKDRARELLIEMNIMETREFSNRVEDNNGTN